MKITVTAISKAELDMRIDDLLARGFTVIKILEPEMQESVMSYTKQNGHRAFSRQGLPSKYRAVLRKEPVKA